MTKKSMYLPIVFTIFLILTAAMMGSFDLMLQKWTAFISLIIILVLMFTPNIKNVFTLYNTPLFVAIIGYVFWNGISVFYADVPKAALFEFTKLIVSTTVFFTVLVLMKPTKKSFKTISMIISITTAFFGIVSIDAASNGPVAVCFKAFMKLFTDNMTYWGGFENGIRITGIFGNANTFAGFMALGVLISLSLVHTSESKRERTASLVLLSINALSYILLFSLGSLFMFFIACILMISTSKKGTRLFTIILMSETAIITLVFTGVTLISLGTSPYIPLLSIILNAVVLWITDSFVVQTLITKLHLNKKGVVIAGVMLIIIFISYVFAAINMTGPLTLSANETVMRAVYLDAGHYRLTSDVKGETTSATTLPTVRIITQNITNLKVHTSTELYNGPLQDAEFTVPDDSKIIKIYLNGNTEGNTIEKVYYKSDDSSSNTTEGTIKLGYKLLPAIAANRIQDLGANENSIQRIVFFEDGIKLFKQSPIIGKGLSGYETGVASVQNFYYETKYVHNHYIQTLCDLGIIGFALFITLLVLCVLSIVKLFKRSKAANYSNFDAFAIPLMTACVFQMFGQAVTDLTWSAGPFLVIAFAILGMLTVIDCSINTDAEMGLKNKKVISGGMVSRLIIIASTLLMTILLTLNLYAHYRAATGNCNMDQIAEFTKIDKFEGDDYKTTYLVNVSTYGLEDNLDQANKFAEKLTKNPDVVLNYLLPYYFNTGQDEKLFETASIVAHAGKASPDIWNQLFRTFDTAIDTNRDDPMPILLHLFGNKEYYIEGLLGYYKDLQKRNATYLDDAMLDAGNVAFIGKLLGIEPLDKSHIIEALDVFVKTIFDSQYAVDANNDNIPDNISVLTGNTIWGQTSTSKDNHVGSGFDGSMKAIAGTTLDMTAYCVRGGEYTVRLADLAGLDGTVAPRDIIAAIDGQPLNVQYDENGAFIKIHLKGATPADEAKNIQAAPASTEKISLSFPTGVQVTRVTIKK